MSNIGGVMKKNKLYLTIIILLSLLVVGETIGIALMLTKNKPVEPIVETPVEPGYVRGKVLTDTGSMVPAGIIIEDQAGNTYRTVTNSLAGYNLRLAPGTYNLYFTKGPEYSVVKKTITVESFKMYYLQDVRLVQLFDAYALGWISGDLHQHTFYSDGTDSVENVLLSNISAGLYYGFLSDHNTALGLSEWSQGQNLVANVDKDGNKRFFNTYEAVEITTEFGHYQSIGAGITFDQYEVVLREIERVKRGQEKDDIIKDKITYIANEIKRAGGVAQINHPYSPSTMGFNYWDIAEHFDTIEIWNGVYVPADGRYETTPTSYSQNYRAKLKWFELLNEVKNGGKFFPATGGTDNHDTASPYRNTGEIVVNNINDYAKLYQKYGKYSGQPTTYLQIDGEVTLEKTLNAIRKGNSFITNGPMVIADIDGKIYGETVALDRATKLNINLFNRDGLEQLKIIKNGEVMQSIDLSGSYYNESIDLNGLNSGDWILLEVLGKDIYYALTNPIFIN
jgi:hypothetical protein